MRIFPVSRETAEGSEVAGEWRVQEVSGVKARAGGVGVEGCGIGGGGGGRRGGSFEEAVAELGAGGRVGAGLELEDSVGVVCGEEEVGEGEFDGDSFVGVGVAVDELSTGSAVVEIEGLLGGEFGVEGVPAGIVDLPEAEVVGGEGVEVFGWAVGADGAVGVFVLGRIGDIGNGHGVDVVFGEPEGGVVFVGGGIGDVFEAGEGFSIAEADVGVGVPEVCDFKEDVVDRAEVDGGGGGEEPGGGGDCGEDGVGGVGGGLDGGDFLGGEEFGGVVAPPFLPLVGGDIAEGFFGEVFGVADGMIGEGLECGEDFAVGAGDVDLGVGGDGCGGEAVVGEELVEVVVVDEVAAVIGVGAGA